MKTTKIAQSKDFKEVISKIIYKLISEETNETTLSESQILELIEIPPNPELGDYAFPCFILAKHMKKSPQTIALDLANKFSKKLPKSIQSIESTGPYLNFKIKNEMYAKQILTTKILFQKTPNKIMVEFSQPNTHKEFHVGHLRNASLGDSIVRIQKFTGNTVIPANYIGDIGTHVAKALWCLEKFHKKENFPENKGKFLGKIYVEASEKSEENEEHKKEISAILQKLELREKKVTALWKKTRKWSIDEFKQIYKDLGIKFDVWYFESEEDEPGKQIANDLLQKGIAKKSEGAIIVNLEEYNLGIALVLKTDGTTLYLTKDLSLAQKKFDEQKIDTSIYIVDSRQSMHLQQVFKILNLMGFKKEMIHIPYEFVSTKDGPISSRKGNVYLYEDLKQRMISKLIIETKKRHSDWTDSKIEKTAQIISKGALKFGMLKIDNNKEIVFDEDEWLDFEGETGPYIQYTYCRLKSIERKDENESKQKIKIQYSELSTIEDKAMLSIISQEQKIIIEAAKNYKPSTIARYLLDLCQKTNEYYHKHQILKTEDKTKYARLALLKRITEIIKRDSELLGIEMPVEM
jgi:arginyl-tRNA synthetase